MSTSFYGSICLTDLLAKAKEKHSGFSKATNGKIYANVTVWLNDEKDKFGNIMSIQVSPSLDMKDSDKKFYIGNLKQSAGPKPISDTDTSELDTELDIPVTEKKPESLTTEDDLPF